MKNKELKSLEKSLKEKYVDDECMTFEELKSVLQLIDKEIRKKDYMKNYRMSKR